jgi:hypothetical protein
LRAAHLAILASTARTWLGLRTSFRIFDKHLLLALAALHLAALLALVTFPFFAAYREGK